MITASVTYNKAEDVWIVRFYNGDGDLIGIEWFNTEAEADRRADAVTKGKGHL